MSTDHRIEPLAREVAAVSWPNIPWRDLSEPLRDESRRIAAFILDREAARVGPLVEALDKAIQCAKWQYEMRTKEAPDSPPRSLFWELDTVLATYRALDASPAPEPSLAEQTRVWRADVLREFCERVDRDLCALAARAREKGAGK